MPPLDAAAHAAFLNSSSSSSPSIPPFPSSIPYESPSRVIWTPGDPFPTFYDWRAVFPFLRSVIAAHPHILKELLETTRGSWHPWPETTLYKPEQGHDWRVVPFCYTFPADNPSATVWVEPSVRACPFTASVLRAIPGLRTALFSRLGPSTSLTSHAGWADLSNHVLRCHLPLSVPDNMPDGEKSCGMVVEGQVMHHTEGDILVFDDSKRHYAFNHHPTHSLAK